ncbi:hypothetical protein Mapa_000906 [Marchantia paleacea]|nr:hypothetical protein Mapa_000906 [Marchantia paleacea]
MASEINKEAFVELQGRLVETTTKLKQVQMQVRNKEVEKKRAFLTLEELNCLAENTNTYKSVGKAFFLTPMVTLVKEQKAKTEECDTTLATLQVHAHAVRTRSHKEYCSFRISSFCSIMPCSIRHTTTHSPSTSDQFGAVAYCGQEREDSYFN